MRRADWEQRLADLIDAASPLPFSYGSHDCALWAAAAVLAQTGADFGAPFRRRYKSAAGASRALRTIGEGDLPSTLTAALGEPVPPSMAGRGDIVMNDAAAAGVCVGVYSLFVTELDGMTRFPTLACAMAWKV